MSHVFITQITPAPHKCNKCGHDGARFYYRVSDARTLCRRCAAVAVFRIANDSNLAAIDAFDPTRDYESLLAQATQILSNDSPSLPLELRLRSARHAVSPHIRLRRLPENHIEATCPAFRRTIGPFTSTHGPRPMAPQPSPLPQDHPSPFQAVVTATRNAIASGLSAKDSRVYVYHLRGEHPVICTLAGKNRVRITSTNNRIVYLETQS